MTAKPSSPKQVAGAIASMIASATEQDLHAAVLKALQEQTERHAWLALIMCQDLGQPDIGEVVADRIREDWE